MNRLTVTLILLVGMLIAFAFVILSNPKTLRTEGAIGIPVRFQLQWFDQAQFAGFYAADQKGFFREQGLQVTTSPGGYATKPIEMLESEQADIALAPADQVAVAISKGQKITVLGVVFDRSMICYMSRKEAGIKSPADFKGKVVGIYPGFDTENVLTILLRKSGLNPEEVDVRPAGQIASFENGDFDVWPSYRFNEPLQMKRKDIDVDCLRPEDFGVPYYSDTIVVSDAFFSKNREAVRRFVHASQKGWMHLLSRPGDAEQIMFSGELNIVDSPENRLIQNQMFSNLTEYVDRPAGQPLFQIEAQRFEDMVSELIKSGMIARSSQEKILKKVNFEFAAQAAVK